MSKSSDKPVVSVTAPRVQKAAKAPRAARVTVKRQPNGSFVATRHRDPDKDDEKPETATLPDRKAAAKWVEDQLGDES